MRLSNNIRFAGTKSIICYKCNSKYDPRCGDPFNPYTIGMVDCNITEVPHHLKGNEPALCRKSVQRSMYLMLLLYIIIEYVI